MNTTVKEKRSDEVSFYQSRIHEGDYLSVKGMYDKEHVAGFARWEGDRLYLDPLFSFTSVPVDLTSSEIIVGEVRYKLLELPFWLAMPIGFVLIMLGVSHHTGFDLRMMIGTCLLAGGFLLMTYFRNKLIRSARYLKYNPYE